MWAEGIQTDVLRNIIFYVFLSTLVPVLVGWTRFRRLPMYGRLLTALVSISFLFDSISRYYWLQKSSNLFLIHIFTLIEFGLLVLVYGEALEGRPIQKKYKIAAGFFALFTLTMAIFKSGYEHYNAIPRVVESVLMLGLVLGYFFKLSQELPVEKIEQEPFFLINVGVLLFFSGSLFVFLYSNYARNFSLEIRLLVWLIHAIFLVIYNLLLSLSLWKAQTK